MKVGGASVALFLPLGFLLQGPPVSRPLCLLGLFANERHRQKIGKLEEGQAMVCLPLLSVFLGISGNGSFRIPGQGSTHS